MVSKLKFSYLLGCLFNHICSHSEILQNQSAVGAGIWCEPMGLPVFDYSQSEPVRVGLMAHVLSLLSFVDHHGNMAGPLGNPANAPSRSRAKTLQHTRLIRCNLDNAEGVAVHKHVVFGVGRSRYHHLGHGLGPRGRQQT